MQPPRRGFRVLGVDPGFCMGCKLAVCDEQGVLLDSGVLYIHRRDQAVKLLLEMTKKHRVNMIALGNGKASREMEKLIGSLKSKLRVPYVVVSEAGASVYSTSKLAKEEFASSNISDVLIIGAVSIARRLQDPLSELVKVPPASLLGVGMYQHDLSTPKLKLV